MIAALRSLALNEWYYLLASSAVLATAALFIYRKLARPAWQYLMAKKQWLGDAINSIEEIRKEMFPNGGSSLRDTVDRTSRMVIDMAKDAAMSVAQNRLLAEQMDVGIFEAKVDGDVVWANRSLRQITGLRLEQIVGTGWFNAIHDDDKRRVENEWVLSMQNLRQYIGIFRFTHVGSGVQTSVQCEATPVFADGGIRSGWLTQFRTIRGTTII